MPSLQKRWLLIFPAFVVIVVAWLGFDFYGFHAKPIPFDRTQWMQGREVVKKVFDAGCVLGGMALDLQKTNRLIQMPTQEIFALLGVPDSSEGKAFLWAIGQCHDGGWQDSRLKIITDALGQVTEVGFQKY